MAKQVGEKKRRVVWFTSDKGGAGKSLMAQLTVSVARDVWGLPVSVYDADGAVGGLYTLLGARGEDGRLVAEQDPALACGFFNLRDRRSDGPLALVNILTGADRVYVDLPGGVALDIQEIVDDGNGVDGLVDAFDDAGYRLTLVHLLSSDIATTRSVRGYRQLFGDRADHVAVRNGYFAARSSAERQFAHWLESPVRQDLLKGGGVEIELSAVHQAVTARSVELRTPVARLVNLPQVQIVERAQIRRLMSATAAALEPVRHLFGG
jgi:hypothetical protein